MRVIVGAIFTLATVAAMLFGYTVVDIVQAHQSIAEHRVSQTTVQARHSARDGHETRRHGVRAGERGHGY